MDRRGLPLRRAAPERWLVPSTFDLHFRQTCVFSSAQRQVGRPVCSNGHPGQVYRADRLIFTS